MVVVQVTHTIHYDFDWRHLCTVGGVCLPFIWQITAHSVAQFCHTINVEKREREEKRRVTV